MIAASSRLPLFRTRESLSAGGGQVLFLSWR
jgi:hypothetical protein